MCLEITPGLPTVSEIARLGAWHTPWRTQKPCGLYTCSIFHNAMQTPSFTPLSALIVPVSCSRAGANNCSGYFCAPPHLIQTGISETQVINNNDTKRYYINT